MPPQVLRHRTTSRFAVFAGLVTLLPLIAQADPPAGGLSARDSVSRRPWAAMQFTPIIPIMGPIRTEAKDNQAPTEHEVILAIERLHLGQDLIFERKRSDIQVTCKPMIGYVDARRYVRWIGPARLRHVIYKCTVRSNQVVRLRWPLPIPVAFTVVNVTEVFYVDHNHYQTVSENDGQL